MKTKGRSITFFSFFPAVALLATPLMFSTLAPATIDSSDWIVPQSQLVLEEFLREQEVRNGEIEEVKFLQYDRDYIYMADDTDDDTAAVDDSRNAPTLTDSGEIDTTYVLQNPEFQRQVEDLSAQAEQAGAALPPLLTLVALFAFAVATGTSSLKDFVKFSTYTEKVKKTIQVTKKVAKTVYRTITETVARKVKTVKQVAYTAYETQLVKVTPPPSVDKLEEMARFMRKTVKENPSFSRPFERNARYYLPNMSDRSEWNNFTIEYGGIATGTRVGGTVHRLQEYFSSPAHTDVKMSLNTISDYFFEGIRFTEPALYEKLKEEFDAIVKPVTEPIVNSTGKPYTAYRDEVETKTVYDTVTREVPETIYEDVTEDREITEDVTKYAFTPLNEKIDLAMSYLKNYTRILQNPSNRNFSDDVLTPNKDLPFFAGAATVYNNLQAELKTANIYNMDRSDPKEVEKLLKRHNEFVYSMKGILEKIRKGQTPEEQMGILFGKTYTDSIRESENAIASAEAEEKAISARFEEIEEMERTNKISTGYARSLYNTAKKNRDQLYRRKRDALKNLKEGKEYYTRRFNGTISSLKNLSFLRSLEDWRNALAYGERSTTASRLVPFTTANGSTVYRRANASTTTQAQPKKTVPNSPVDLQPSGLFSRKVWSTKKLQEVKADEKVKWDRITKEMMPSDEGAATYSPDVPYPISQLGYVTSLKSEQIEALRKQAVILAKEYLDLNQGKASREKIEQQKYLELLMSAQASAASAQLKNVVLHSDSQLNAILHSTNRPVYNLTREEVIKYEKQYGKLSDSQREWHTDYGSAYHVGKQLFAADMNLGSGWFDQGQPVFASRYGTVAKVVKKDGYVVVEHNGYRMVDGKNEFFKWWTGYMHMDNIRVEVGDWVTQETHIGNVSDITSVVPDMKPHLHFAIFAGGNSYATSNSIDLTSWLKHHRLQ